MEQPSTPDRVISIRVYLGLTQTEFANLIGVSFTTVNRWENGHYEPTNLAWEKIKKLENRMLRRRKP